MTQQLDTKTQALIDAAKELLTAPDLHDVDGCEKDPETNAAEKKVRQSLADFEPEPEWEYGPMPEWKDFRRGRAHDVDVLHAKLGNFMTIHRDSYNALRELTRRPVKAKGREFWLSWRGFGQGEQLGSIQLTEKMARHVGDTIIHVREVTGEKP
jgi:hypothetical protein